MTGATDIEFAQIVLRNADFVHRVAYAVLGNAHDAEDAAQETFLKLFRNGGWRQMEQERAFLARVSWRVAQDYRTRRSTASFPSSAAEPQPILDQLASTLPDPERRAVDSSQQARLHDLIAALPEELRLPLVLASLEGMNSRQASLALGIPEGTVRTRLQRARQMLRQKLEALDEDRKEAAHARAHSQVR